MSALSLQDRLVVTQFPIAFMNMLASFDLATTAEEINWLIAFFGPNRPDVIRKASQARGTLMFQREVELGYTSKDDIDSYLPEREYLCA